MSYTAGSFVADEQPTTAKWNLLWANDASFNDGTGFADNILDSRMYIDGSIDPEHLASTARWWEELGRTTLGSSSDLITVASFTAKKYLKMYIYLTATGGTINGKMTFNNDSGASSNNYAQVSSTTYASGS